MALALAESGAAVCIAQRDLSNKESAEVIKSKVKNAIVHTVQCDLRNMDDAKAVFQKGLDAFGGPIDVLINCGGLLKRKETISVTEEDWDSVSTSFAFALLFADPGPLRSSTST